VIEVRQRGGVDPAAAGCFSSDAACIVFDKLINDCYDAVHDPLRQDMSGCDEATVADPTLSLPTGGDYKALPRQLMFRILSMPSHLDAIKKGLSNARHFSGRPEYEEFFEYRREHWSGLGLQALDVVDALCREYNIPVSDRPRWSRASMPVFQRLQAKSLRNLNLLPARYYSTSSNASHLR
jgi:hypothetical protein